MKKNYMKLAFTIIIVFVCFLCFDNNFIMSGERTMENIYIIGETKRYMVIHPKQGMFGGPMSYASVPYFYPSSSNDFEMKLVKVSIESKISNGKYRAKVIVTDISNHDCEIDCFYLIIQQSDKSVYVCCQNSDEIFPPGKENLNSRDPRNLIKFPFMLARSPAFSIDTKLDGYLLERGLPASFKQIKNTESRSPVIIEALKFYYHSQKINTNNKDIIWLGKEMKQYMDDQDFHILFREIQEWDKEDDWLWKKMIRFDNFEYLCLYCIQIDTDAPKIPFPEEVLELIKKQQVQKRRKIRDPELKREYPPD
jgi:hypothetical protein